MGGFFSRLFSGFSNIDDDFYEELFETMVIGDIGVRTSEATIEKLKEQVKENHIKNPEDCKAFLKQNIKGSIKVEDEEYDFLKERSVVFVIGVNGVGKTTTIGKLASLLKKDGKKVMVAAADTFRAAATEQLEEWANRAGVDIVKHKEGADPAAVVYDTIQAGKARDCDIIICDTAGRLHNKKNLMDELAKIYRIIDKELPYNDRESLLVLDATTGQNAVNQAREFKNVAEITGIVLTKLDGSAKGGVVLAIKNDLKVPVKFVGVGEQIDDLQPFNPEAFAQGLFNAEVKHDETNMFMPEEPEKNDDTEENAE